MTDLETAIRSAAKAGRLNHLSLAVTWEGKWEASYRGVDHKDHRITTHSDPASALLMALTGRKVDEPKPTPKKRRSKLVAPPKPAAAVEEDEDDLL